jgi:hypothetical protein
LAITATTVFCAAFAGFARADDDPAVAALLDRLRAADERLARSSYAAHSVLERPARPVVNAEQEVTSVGPLLVARVTVTSADPDRNRQVAIYRGASSAGLWQSNAKYGEQIVFADGVVQGDALAGMLALGGGRPLSSMAYGVGSMTLLEYLTAQRTANRTLQVSADGDLDVLAIRLPQGQGGGVACRIVLQRRGRIPICRSIEEFWPSGKLNRVFQREGELAVGDDLFVPRVLTERYYGHPGSAGGPDDPPPESVDRTTFLSARVLSDEEAARQVFDETRLRMPPGTSVIRTATDGTRTLLRTGGDGKLIPIEVLGGSDGPQSQLVAFARPPADYTPAWKTVLRLAAAGLALVGIAVLAYWGRRRTS